MNKNSKNRKIALLYDCPYPFVQGGGQKRLFEIATRLVQKGWQVDWYALKFWEGANQIDYQGIHYVAVGNAVPLYKPNGKRSLKEALYYGSRFLNQRKLTQYAIIHAGQWPYFHLYFARAYAFLGKGCLVIDWWEVWGKRWKEYAAKMGLLGRGLEWLSSRLTSNIIAISEQGRQQLAQLGVQPSAIQVIHNGIDFNEIQVISVCAKPYDFVYMGRLVSHKNLHHLIKALALVRSQGFEAKLKIIGDGPERASLEEMVRALKLAESVEFCGIIADQKEAFGILKAAKCFVHPSTKEGGGSITALEANACGLPVIAYQHENGIAREFIEDAVNGYWVDSVSAEKLAAKLVFFLAQGNFSKDRILEKVRQFDWDNIANQYHEYFQRVVRE